MKNTEQWKPSKFVFRHGTLIASRNTDHICIGSRFAANIIAKLYGHYLPLHATGRLVDLGCGTVPLFEAYRPYIAENICVDWGGSPHECSHLDHECDLNQPLPLGDGEFDTIILSDVLEHIAEPDQLWQEMGRILAPGGKILLNVPFFYWLHETPHDYYRYTEFALRRFAERHGFEVLVLEATGGTPEILADIANKRLRSKTLIGPPLANLFQWLTRLYLRTSSGRKRSRKTSKAFPFGYFMVAQKKN